MKYGRYYVSVCPDDGIERTNPVTGEDEICSGYYCRVYTDSEYEDQEDDFCLAVGYEIPDDSEESLDKGIRWYLDLPEAKEQQEEKEINEILAAEDAVQTTAYLANAPDCCSEAEQFTLTEAEKMVRDYNKGLTVLNQETAAMGTADVTPLKMLTQEEADIIYAKHLLWLHKAGGERADFSRCDLRELYFCGANLQYASFQGSEIWDCEFRETDLRFADFTSAAISQCDMTKAIADAAVFLNSQIDRCQCRKVSFSLGNFQGAVIQNSNMNQTDWTNCLIDDAVWINTSRRGAVLNRENNEEMPNCMDTPQEESCGSEAGHSTGAYPQM